MAWSDREIFLESLRMWDRRREQVKPNKGQPVIGLEDDIDKIVDNMFEKAFDLKTNPGSNNSAYCSHA